VQRHPYGGLSLCGFAGNCWCGRVSTYNQRLCIELGDSLSANLTMTNTHAANKAHDSDIPDGVFDEEFKPLTAEEVRQWRQSNPSMSPWWVIRVQGLVACVLAMVVWSGFGRVVAVSAVYGAVAVIFPAMVLARGLRRQPELRDSGAAFLSFVVWEVVKVVLTVALLLLAPKLVPQLNWLALVAGFVVTMKVYWVAAWLQSKRRIQP
jgi:ATP synthase protein I